MTHEKLLMLSCILMINDIESHFPNNHGGGMPGAVEGPKADPNAASPFRQQWPPPRRGQTTPLRGVPARRGPLQERDNFSWGRDAYIFAKFVYFS